MSYVCVAHVTQSFGCGGLERVIANLVSHKHKNQVRHIVISLSDDLSFGYALPDNVKLISVNKKPGKDLMVHARMIKVFREHNVTTLHTYNFGTLEYHLSAKFAGIKNHVHADHGLGGDHPEGANKKHNIFRKYISRLINHYIVVSDDLKKWVTESVGVKSDKVSFVFNGVHIPPPARTKLRKPSKLNMVIIGRLAKVKNHKRLINAIKHLEASYPDMETTCTIVGGGPEKESIMQYVASQLTYPERINMVGHQDDVANFIDKSDALILSSDYEAMPMTVLEAMARSKSVICPKVGGVEDFISDKEAILVKGNSALSLADGIRKLHMLPHDEEALMNANAYKLVSEQYSIECMFERYISMYK